MRALLDELRERAEGLGFARVGVARAEPLGEEAQRLRQWLAAGRHGQMGYMRDTEQVRADPGHEGMLPGARSVVVLATPYARVEPPTGPAPARVARYAQGRDYHNVLGKRARKLAAWLRDQGHATRAAVDSMPVFERAWAVRAGLGFIGKNCCLIIPGMGSHVLLAALVTRAELPSGQPLRERCGSCTRCLDACPTRAFVDARQLDARRCISYLTIEHRGAIDSTLRPQVGPWLFGCDVCQDVCPFNATSPPPAETTAPFAAHARWQRPIEDLLRMDESEFAAYAEGSPIKRPGVRGMARNAAVVLGNGGSRRHLPVLQETAARHADADVRESAEWALVRLQERLRTRGELP